MARSDRLFRLLQALRTLPSPVTAARLADETGVSLRSLYRDIDSLRAAGAVIDGERGFGYRLTEDIALPPQTFTRLELEALVLGLAEVRHMGEPDLAAAAGAVLSKITATLPDRLQRQALHAASQVYRFERRDPPVANVGLLREACWLERAVVIAYVDADQQRTDRKILPLAIVYLERVLVLLAWCCLRQGFRKFRIDRVADIRMTEESFRPRRVPMLRDFVASLNAGAPETSRMTLNGQ
ncbi:MULTISPECIES: helix-turn-helix transcriptional regulator [unclassified Shinella]|jgi:predicted DNA-binding transcriptional regulator YafY|uniref:helix-turn-helix transcriptional regulator n=1 Tax=unclassified Shinella TaxID=2643062 RepID=UPI000437BD61|nr:MULTISPECIES: YafY family protein [unclassified Shinella]MCA0343347.1 YafY family transcriptional regulator [Pseudomonadota bacterium]EYR80214.1 putative transcriptional regulator [Shinella sp. DD12]MCO5148719.1 YafY family transcriptional regulator [Shinella sp.]MDC7264780.1 YafY family transcriptional regulator [Shinella sp. HY16]MDC7271677.1 YafY family transcriptional regulator [Shinella sp. YZ44]